MMKMTGVTRKYEKGRKSIDDDHHTQMNLMLLRIALNCNLPLINT